MIVALWLGSPSIATAQELPSPEAIEQSIVDSLRSPSQALPPNFLRLSDRTEKTVDDLGPLKELAGTWVGQGWNLIAVPINSASDRSEVGCPGPDASPPKEGFCVEIAPYVETITFTPIGAKVPNRGFPKNTFVVGLHYEQKVSDAKTFQPLHIENGMWLLLDEKKKIVARLSSIPHGNSILATGTASDTKEFLTIKPVSGLPILANPDKAFGYAERTYGAAAERTAGANKIPKFRPDNPNKILQDVLDQQKKSGLKLLDTTILKVSTKNHQGGIVNIPFIEKNADVSSFDSVFWIEQVQNKQGKDFLQLQYSQTTNLDFIPDFTVPKNPTSTAPTKLIVWPHVDVSTLVKQ